MDTTTETTQIPQSAWRVIAAFLIAPMAAALAMACVQPLYAGLPNIWARIYLTAFDFSVIGAYPATVTIGVPTFFFLRERVAASLANCSLTGACVAAMPWLALGFIPAGDGFSAYSDGHQTVVAGHYTLWGWIDLGKFVLEIAAFGALGGVVFWLIASAGNSGRAGVARINP